jgi:transmembrane sensor
MHERHASQEAEIQRQASEWLARFDGGQVSAADHLAFRIWSGTDPRHQAAYAALEQSWRRLDHLAAVDLEPQRRPRRARQVAIAASLLLAASLAVVLSASLFDGANWYVTEIGEQRRVTLADGSSVELNTDTRLRFVQRDGTRLVELDRGEALFDVAPDPAHPFVVRAGDSSARAVGTEFAVQLRGRAVEILVTHGTVEVTRAPTGDAPSERTLVTAGQEVAVAAASLQPAVDVDHTAQERKLAWRRGMLRFDGETLEQVVAEVGRYTRIHLVVADPELRAMRVGGYFRATDTARFLQMLENNFGVRGRRTASDTIVLERTAAGMPVRQ